MSKRKSVIAVLCGNALAWYDFLLYASFAPIFAEIFFPAKTVFTSVMLTFSVFAVSFLMRPIGGVVLGYYGDYTGRRKILIISSCLMSVSTLCMGFLPTYQSMGILATILFILFRFMQGFAMGGELPGSATFLIEHMFAKRRGFAGSLAASSLFFGIFLAFFVAALLISILPDVYSDLGWRLAYILGGLLGVVAFYYRIKCDESPYFLNQSEVITKPVRIIFSKYKTQLSLAIIYTSVLAVGNYILIAYVTTFLVKFEGFLFRDALIINFMAILFLTLLIPVIGFLSDYWGRKSFLLFGLVSLLLYIFPSFWLLSHPFFHYALSGELLLSIALAPINAVVPTMIAEMFPVSVRISGLSLGYNVGQAVFGGTAAIAAFSLIKMTGNYSSPALYVFFIALVVLVVTHMTNATPSE